MNFLSDVITYIRRIVKTPSDVALSDSLIIDYINRFVINDMDARVQLFDFKTKYQFQTIPGIDKYNMPLYPIQTESGSQQISFYPVYQGFTGFCTVNGVPVKMSTQAVEFWNIWPDYTQQLVQAGTGTGSGTTYTLNLPFSPAIAGHIDMSGLIARGSNQDPPLVGIGSSGSYPNVPVTSIDSRAVFTATGPNGQNITVQDTGLFLSDNTDGNLYGILGYVDHSNPNIQYFSSYSTTLNTICYNTGVANVTFPVNIPSGNPIMSECYFYQQGTPRAILFYNNTITLRAVPNTQYTVEMEGYLTPAAFLSSSQALAFGYMSEYIARGAARKILADTGDTEQFAFYEPLFREQENLVWKRSQRQITANRTQTIYSQGGWNQGGGWNGSYGGGIS